MTNSSSVGTLRNVVSSNLLRAFPAFFFFFSAPCVKVFADQLVEYTGTDIIDPPLVFPIGDTVVAEYSSWSAIAGDCGNSRLWGGMHFYVSGRSFVRSLADCPSTRKQTGLIRPCSWCGNRACKGVCSRSRRRPRERTPVRVIIARRESNASLRTVTTCMASLDLLLHVGCMWDLTEAIFSRYMGRITAFLRRIKEPYHDVPSVRGIEGTVEAPGYGTHGGDHHPYHA